MEAVLDALDAMHFLRPLWLFGLPVIVAIWWGIKRKARSPAPSTEGIAPHLASALTVGDPRNSRLHPIDNVAIIMALLVIAAAGPTWSRIPNPFIAQTAPMIVALEVTRSMEAPDLQPGRLERAKFKIMDLVEARAGARTGLVAYSGSAHRVTPLTEDPDILRVMLAGLTPEIMPSEGANVGQAIELARLELEKSDTPGAILLVTDGIDGADIPALTSEEGEAPVIVLLAAPAQVPLGALEGSGAKPIIRLSADNTDVDKIQNAAASAYRAALLEDERLDWDDRGWVVGWPAALLLLFWFRKGWTTRWVWILMASGLFGLPAGQGRADVADWFFTQDQQGMMAYRNKDYTKALEHFQDPMWRGFILMKNGGYSEAADLYARIDTPEAAFAQGYAHIRNREYRPAIAAYERALELQPDFPEAARNLDVAKAVLESVETAREQSDTGEESGIGADEVVFDNEANRGADTNTEFEQGEEKPEFATTEEWMRSVDTNMEDFLRTRFQLEASQAKP